MDIQLHGTKAEVIVVGAGIAGASTAFWLSRTGLRPLIVERLAAPGAATTAASAHSVRAQFVEPANIRMMRESLDFYGAFAERLGLSREAGDIQFRRGGYVFASTNERAPAEISARVAIQREHGLDDVEVLSTEDVQRRFPWMSPTVTAASYRARDGWIDGVRATRLLLDASEAQVEYDTEVLEVLTASGRVTGMRTSHGTIATDTVVLAAGPFTAALAGESLPLELVRRNRLILAARLDIPAGAPMTVDADTGAHWRPHQGGALVAWARPETPSPPMWPVPPDPGFPKMVLQDRDGVGRLTPFWHKLAPCLLPSEMQLTAGQYVITPDHMPIIGPAAETSGLWFHTGYSGHGIMGSPSGGRTLADLLMGRLAAVTNPFRLERFVERTDVRDNERMVL